MFLKGLWDQHRAQKWNREQLRKSFGKAGRTEYADGELNGIVRYFEKHPKDFQIDDITWNDLNLDEIFLRMNSTCSSAGQEYLYAMLRSPSFEEKELQEREKLLEFLEQDEETRVRMQEIFFKIGRTGKYSLYDYMDFLDVLGERKNGKHLLVDLLFFLTIAAAFVSPPLGLCGVSIVMCFNITTYLKGAVSDQLSLYFPADPRGGGAFRNSCTAAGGKTQQGSKAVATVWKAEQKCVTWDAYVERRSDGYRGGLYQYDAASGHHRIQHHAACGAGADGKY